MPRYEGIPARYRPIYEKLQKQKYHFVGRHTVVKKCYWNHAALTQGRFCYKCKFYGIESHRCIQMSPAALWCWNACLHCWRLRPSDTGYSWDEVRMPFSDEPKDIVDGIIEEYRRILSGYKGHPRVDMRLLREAWDPRHVAISLTGEPTLYSKLEDLIREVHRRGMTTFLVTRGVRPDVLGSLSEEPSQLYISLEGWDKKSYNIFTRPLVPRAWDLTLKSIEFMRSYSSPTVFRITLVKGFNDGIDAIKGFSRLIELGEPTYIEVKAYMHVGASRDRLSRENMPTHEEVREFAERLSQAVGYPIRSESKPSRVVLLTPLRKPIRHGSGCPEGWKAEDRGYLGEYEDKDPETKL